MNGYLEDEIDGNICSHIKGSRETNLFFTVVVKNCSLIKQSRRLK